MTICLPVNVSWSSKFLTIQMSLATCLRTVATIRPLLFLVVTQPTLVGVYRRFRTAYPSHLQGSRVNFLTLEDGTEGLSRNIGKQSQTYAAQNPEEQGPHLQAMEARNFATVFGFRAVNGLALFA
jgi:hypothetical protein